MVNCFRHGGGVPYSAYERFHALMAEDSATVHDAALLDGILPLVPGAIERLAAGIDVADIGCGHGHAVNLMAGAFPASRFTGFDFSEAAIAAAQREGESLGLVNARFEVCDVATLDTPSQFDPVTAFDAIHDQAHPGQVLANIAAALRPDAAFLMVDIKASSNLEDNIGFLGGRSSTQPRPCTAWPSRSPLTATRWERRGAPKPLYGWSARPASAT